MMSEIKAIFWDLDGTLVDSEWIAVPAAVFTIQNMLAAQGRTAPADLRNRFHGRTSRQILPELENELGMQFPIDALEQIKRQVARELAIKILPCKGVQSVLENFKKQGLLQSIVTSSALDRVELSLNKTGLADFFPVEKRLSAVDSLSPPKLKPDPAIYLHALTKFGLSAHEAIAIEDSPAGVASARAAGLRVLGYVGASHYEGDQKRLMVQELRRLGASDVVADLAAIPLAVINLAQADRPMPTSPENERKLRFMRGG